MERNDPGIMEKLSRNFPGESEEGRKTLPLTRADSTSVSPNEILKNIN
jgi:hypothetical protein